MAEIDKQIDEYINRDVKQIDRYIERKINSVIEIDTQINRHTDSWIHRQIN